MTKKRHGNRNIWMAILSAVIVFSLTAVGVFAIDSALKARNNSIPYDTEAPITANEESVEQMIDTSETNDTVLPANNSEETLQDEEADREEMSNYSTGIVPFEPEESQNPQTESSPAQFTPSAESSVPENPEEQPEVTESPYGEHALPPVPFG